MAFPIGGLLGAISLPFLGNIFGWRKTVILPGVITILCALFISHFYQEKRNKNNSSQKDNKNNTSFWKCFYLLIKNKELVKISIFGFFLGVMSNSINAHFTLFLFLDYNLPIAIAGIGFAMVLAPPIFGYIADLRGSYNLSWFLLGIIMFFASIGQYLSFSKK